MKSHLRPLAGLAAIVCAACSAETGPNISGVPAFDIRRVEVSPLVDTIFIPDTVRATDRLQFTAKAFGLGSEVLPVNRYVWGVEDTTIAVVDSFGLVTPRRVGSTKISASATRIGDATIVILPAANRVVVNPTVDTVFFDDPGITAADTGRLFAQTLDQSNAAVPGVRYAWQSSAAGVVAVDSTGRIRAVSAGSATISVRVGALQATSLVQVLPIVKEVRVATPASSVLDGDTLQLSTAATDYNGSAVNRVFAWTSSNASVATIDASGRAIFVSPGSVTFTATTAFRSASVSVTALRRELVTTTVGDQFGCGIAPLGRGYCWGVDSVGQVGAVADSACITGTPNCVLAPKRLAAPSPSLGMIDAGSESACGIDLVGSIYCWGSSRVGQVGNGRIGVLFSTPQLATVRNERFSTVSVGGRHACALNLAGLAFCWGDDAKGQLGDNRQEISSTPIPVVGMTGLETDALRYSAISAGSTHTCAIEQSTGRAYCWGDGAAGQLGNGATDAWDTPRAVSSSLAFSRIASGTNHTCAVTTAGALYCWGDNSAGQLSGTGSQLVPALVGAGYSDVTVGEQFTCALTTGGEIRCFGSNSHGQLGRGEGNPGGTANNVAGVVGGQTWRSVSAGRRSVCGIDTAGDAYCWGSNSYGALGNSLQAAVRSSPQRVARLR